MSKSSDELLAKLKTSIPKALSKDASPALPPPNDPKRDRPVASELVSASVRAPKLSVSLYQADVKRLDGIKDFMKEHGFRNLNDSEALRLACRSVEIGDHFISVYRAMQQEDGRRKPRRRLAN
jgi:hypothetical protein